MENNYFVFTDGQMNIEFERFHICTWEFKDNTSIIEFGGELKYTQDSLSDEVIIYLYIPWLSDKNSIHDLYDKLKDPENCKFIFNDSINGNTFLDGGNRKNGVIQKFAGRTPLCILPIITEINGNYHTAKVVLNCKPLKHLKPQEEWPNIYFRFYFDVDLNMLSTRKDGISKSSILYDFKINEKRNLPINSNIDLQRYSLTKIRTCFCFNILPNSYEPTFFDNISLKNIRTLEYDSFKRYLGDRRVKADEYIVVFNKKKNEESYGFFSVYTKERIGAGQFSLAMLVSIISGVLLFLPSFRNDNHVSIFSKLFWSKLPLEIYLSLSIGLLIFFYFVWPSIIFIFKKILRFEKRSNK